MGFGGSALAANQTIRNNRNLLKQKRKVGKLSYVPRNTQQWKDPKKASFNQLLEIRRKIKKERQTRMLKIGIITLIGCMIIVFCYVTIDWSVLIENFFSASRMK